MATVLDRILVCAENFGWHFFPIRRGAKSPALIKWGDGSSCDPVVIRGWASRWPECNWGLATGKSKLFVLDVDGEVGEESLVRLEEEFGPIPHPTLTVETPSGGRHYYFSGEGRTSARIIGSGLDTRGLGGMVLFPGSVVDGRPYRVVVNQKPAKVPAWLPRLVERAKPQVPVTSDADILLDSPAAIEQARAYLERRDGAEMGHGGDAHTYTTFCGLRDLGISKDKALELFHEIYNPKCTPEWSVEEAEIKAHNAWEYAQNPQGAYSVEADFSAVSGDGEPVITAKEDFPDRPMSASALFKLPVEPRRWIVEDWVPEGELVSLYGDGGQGKSLLALQLMVAAASKTPWLGLPVERTYKTFGLFCEDNWNEVNGRLHSIVKGTGLEFALDNISLWCRTGKSNTLYTVDGQGVVAATEFLNELRKILLQDLSNHKLVVLDTLADIYSGSEMNREHVGRFLKEKMKGLMLDTNSTFLFLAHPSRAGMAAGDMLSGSTGWNNSVRVRLTLGAAEEKNPTAPLKALTRAKSNYAKSGEKLTIVWADGRYVPVSADSPLIKETEVIERMGFEADCAMILDKIRGAAQNGYPYSYGGRVNRIEMIEVNTSKNEKMTRQHIKKVVDNLIATGYITHIAKQDGRKALYPVESISSTVFTQLA